MRHLLLITVAASALSACAVTPPPSDLAAPPPMTPSATELGTLPETSASPAMAYAPSRRTDVVETQFGVPVADPYRWLENDVRTDPEVRSWVDAQNKVTQSYLASLPGRDTLKARMTALYNYERIGAPVKKGGRYFYQRNAGLQNQSPLYVRDSLNGKPRLLIDPNNFSADGATALAEWVPSEDGKYLAYAIQDGGSDWRTVKVLDVATGKLASDEVKWVKFSALSWAKDGSGFIYSRFPETAAGQDFQSLNKNQTVYFHRLGTPQSADRKLFARPDRPELSNGAQISDDGSTVIVTSSSGTDDRYEVTLLDWRKPNAKPRVLIPGFKNNYSYVGNVGSRYYFITNDGAPKLKVVAIDIAAAKPNSRDVIPEDTATLDGANLVGGKLIASYLKDASTEVRVHSLSGARERSVTLPGLGTASGFNGKLEDKETFFSFSSYNRPSTVYRYDVATGNATEWAAP